MAGKALTLAAFGARGTGKTAWVIQQIKTQHPPRLLIWDFKHDPPLVAIGQPVTSLASLARLADQPAFVLRYLVDHTGPDMHQQFEYFCKIAWAAGNLLMFVDELPEVTKASKAPPAWRRCVNVGREYRDGGQVKHLAIIGAGQRPAECDKSFISNADVIHCGRLANPDDAREMGKALGVPFTDLMRLPDLHWIEKRADQMDCSRGVLQFADRKPQSVTEINLKKPTPSRKLTAKKPALRKAP